MRTKQLSPRTENSSLAALEHREYGSIDCDRLGVRSRVNDYDFRRITDPNSIVVEIHEPCRSVRDHSEKLGQPFILADLENVSVQVGHAD